MKGRGVCASKSCAVSPYNSSSSSPQSKSVTSYVSRLCRDRDLIGLSHFTNMSNLHLILTGGALYSKPFLPEGAEPLSSTGRVTPENPVRNEFPGVFMCVLTKEAEEMPIKKLTAYTENAVVLVFSKVLLHQNNYHLRLHDNMGIIDKDAVSKPNIERFVKDMVSRTDDGHYDNEIIFHDAVPLTTLQAIWVPDISNFNTLQIKYRGTRYHDMFVNTVVVPSGQNYNMFSDLTLKELTTLKIIDTKSFPNYCFYLHINAPTDLVNKLAAHCGMKKKDGETINVKKFNSFISLSKPSLVTNGLYPKNRIKPISSTYF